MPNKFHIVARFYLSGCLYLDVVADKDLTKEIEYNRTFRPGCFYFVDGEYVCGGMLKSLAQEDFITQCQQRLAEIHRKASRNRRS